MNVSFKNVIRKTSYVASGCVASLLPVVAHANDGSGSGTSNSSLVESLVTGFTSTTNDALSGIAKIAPVALPIIGAIVVVTLGIKIFKRISRG